jgi:hypothetical protein
MNNLIVNIFFIIIVILLAAGIAYYKTQAELWELKFKIISEMVKEIKI